MQSVQLCVCDGQGGLSSCPAFFCSKFGPQICCCCSFWQLLLVIFGQVALSGGTNSPNTMLSDAFHQVFKGDDRIFQTGFFISSSIWLCLAFNAFSRIQAQRRTKAAEAAVESNVVGTGRI